MGTDVMHFYVVVAFRGRPDLLKRCLESILSQEDDAYTVLVGDDCSEPTMDLESVLIDATVTDRVRVMRHEQHRGTLRNQVALLREQPMNPEDVIVFCDGDDRLAHPGVLSFLRGVYADPTVDLTYGNYEPDPPSATCPPVRPIPADVCAEGRYRSWHARYGCRYNHLRTARRRLFDAMDDDANFVRDGAWLQCAPDHALYVPFLELAGGRHRMIEEPLLIYTSDRPDAEWRTRGAEITANTNWILGLPPYSPLEPMST